MPGVQTGPDANNTALPRLIAFAPSVELLFSKRDQVHPAFLRSIVAAALLSKRVPVFPLVPCDSAWLTHRDAHSVAHHTQEATNMVDRFVVPVGPGGDLRCFWKAWSCKKCDRIGMPWYEFDRVLQDMPRFSRKPTESAPPLSFHRDAAAFAILCSL